MFRITTGMGAGRGSWKSPPSPHSWGKKSKLKKGGNIPNTEVILRKSIRHPNGKNNLKQLEHNKSSIFWDTQCCEINSIIF
jgi:hypothetical protein